MKNKIHYAPIVLVLLLLFPGNVSAQSINENLKSLSAGADLVISGKVVVQESKWNSDKTRIFTEATIKVDEYLKGENFTDQIVVTYPGGEVEEVGEFYSHVATFTNEEEVIVFLKRFERDNTIRVYQGDTGKIAFYEDRNTGEKLTMQNVKVSELKKAIKSYVEKL